MTEWQDIETAPKDGTEVLLAGPLYDDIKNGLYRAIGSFRNGAWYEDEDADHPLWTPVYWLHIPPLQLEPSSKAQKDRADE